MVAGTLLLGFLAVYATIDVGTLLVNGSEDAAGVAIKLVFRLGVANALDGVAGNGLQVDIGFGMHLAHDYYLSGGDECLDGAAGLVVVGEKLVEQRVGYLVGHLVGMAF